MRMLYDTKICPAWHIILFLATLATQAIAFQAAGKPRPEIGFLETSNGAWSTHLEKIVPVGNASPWSIATVSVTNNGKSQFEPLVFNLYPTSGENRGAIETKRVAPPHNNRLGRPVLPGEKVLYEVLINATADVFDPIKTAADTEAKQYFSGSYKSEPHVKILSKKAARAQKAGAWHTETHIDVENTSEHAVDAVFHATMRLPAKVETLLNVRLNPHEKKPWIVNETPGGASGPWPDCDIQKLQLVDWCEIFDGAETTPQKVRNDRIESKPGASTPPTGSGVVELTTAWNATYRFPDEKVRITGEYIVETPGTDGVWRGYKKLSGTFTLDGFHLGRHEGGSALPTAPAVDGPTGRALSEIVLDRFGIWFGRDITGRAHFQEAFAGSIIQKDRSQFTISTGPFSIIELSGPRIAKFTFRNKAERVIEHERLGNSWVVTCYTTGDEILRATWKDLGGGWLFPSSFEFRSVFSKQWGPEKLTFSKLSVTKQ